MIECFNVTPKRKPSFHLQPFFTHSPLQACKKCNLSLQNTDLKISVTEGLSEWETVQCMWECVLCALPMRKNDNWKRLKFKPHWQDWVWRSSYGKNVFYEEFFCHFKYLPAFNFCDCTSCKTITQLCYNSTVDVNRAISSAWFKASTAL